MTRSAFETILGALVLVVAVGFLSWAYARGATSESGDYELTATFAKVDGLEVGAEVRLSGINVGQVLAQDLDLATYQAVVRFSVRDDVELPIDSSAAIVSASLLGGKYLALEPGAEDLMLASGEAITLTQSSVSLEDLIGQFIFSQAEGS